MNSSQFGEVAYYCGVVCDLLNSWETLHHNLAAVASASRESFDSVAARAKSQRIISQRLPKALQQLRNEVSMIPSNTSIVRKHKSMCLLECFYFDVWRAFAEKHHRSLRLDTVATTARGRCVAEKLAMVIEDSFALENNHDGDFDPLLSVLVGNLKLRISEVNDAIYAPIFTLDDVGGDEALRSECDFFCAAALALAQSIGVKCGVTLRAPQPREGSSSSEPPCRSEGAFGESNSVAIIELQTSHPSETDKEQGAIVNNRGRTCEIM